MEKFNIETKAGEGKEKQETEPKLLFKLLLMRHEETDYNDMEHDLTEKGAANAIGAGMTMKEDDFFPNKETVISFHSPKSRAKETLILAAKEAGIPTENSRPITILRPSDISNVEAFEKHTDKELQGNPTQIAKAFYTHELHKDHPEIIEPHLKKKQRLYRALEYLIRFAMKDANKRDSAVPQIFAVSHFEIITHLIDDVFGIENTGYRSPAFGEQVKISAFQGANSDQVLLKVTFRDQTSEVMFDRKTRSIAFTSAF